MFDKQIVIDGKGHIMGRLAAIVAKNLLGGQRIVVVRVEKLVLTGLLFNRRKDYLEWKNKQSNTNPRKGGPYHYKTPTRLFWKAVRGMLPHKSARGTAALERLKIFEGMPHPYSTMKKQCVPKALKTVRLNRGRKSCLLGDLCSSVGWNYGPTVEKLEKKRMEKGETYYQNKSKLERVVAQETQKLPEVNKLKKQLEGLGY